MPANQAVDTPGDSALAQRLRREVTGDVFFDAFNRGRYATDASFYQILPAGVVVPRTVDEALRTPAIARDDGRIVTPRGGGTSQCGQTVNTGIVVDVSKHLNKILSLDVENRTCVVEPGIVLDDLNRQLKRHGLWFPVDVSTASRATIGGMAGNNSCGGRSLRYGTMRDNTLPLEAALADGRSAAVRQCVARHRAAGTPTIRRSRCSAICWHLGDREAGEIAERFPKVQRRVGGYNLDALAPNGPPNNMAHILVGSEGTLAFTTEGRTEAVAADPQQGASASAISAASMRRWMPPSIWWKLKPIAVELVDRTMIGLGRDIAMFRPTIEAAVRGDPDALLVVEFAEEDQADNPAALEAARRVDGRPRLRLNQAAAALGRRGRGDRSRPCRPASPDFRAAGLNVMMSMKTGGQAGLLCRGLRRAAATARGIHRPGSNRIFEKHGTHPTMYAHASEGCLHVRPVLNPQARQGRQGDAGDRGGNLRDGAGIQGLALRRTR